MLIEKRSSICIFLLCLYSIMYITIKLNTES